MSDYIPEDNLFIILKHLPVKTLLRFRSVCKDWKQFIDSPIFTQHHLSVQKPRFIVDIHEPKYLVVDPQPKVYNLSKPLTENYLLIVGTLHGVVCFYDFDNLVLWNPSLRKFSSRLFPSSFEWYFKAPLLNSYGFWIDPSTKEFKVIMLQQKPVLKCIMYSSSIPYDGDGIEIHTGKIAKWNPCREGPPVIVGGVAHWGGCLDESDIDSDHQYRIYHHSHTDNAILSFDFVRESFDIIEMPDLDSREYSPCRWQGTLSFVCWDDYYPCECELYSRQEDSWVKMVGFKVDDSRILRVFWAMEDVEATKQKRNRKKDVELERLGDLFVGETQENVKILATSDRKKGGLFLHGNKTGRKALRTLKYIKYYDDVFLAYDFVESLLFP